MSVTSGNTNQSVPKNLEFDRTLWRRRALKDIFARYFIGAGGIAVIGSIILIFMFLFSIVFPLFKEASLYEETSYKLEETNHETLIYSIEEQAEIGMRLDMSGAVNFFNVDTGRSISKINLLQDSQKNITSWAHIDKEQNIIGLGLSDGKVLIFRHQYLSKYSRGDRTITPNITFPYGVDALDLEIGTTDLNNIAISDNDEGITIFAVTSTGPYLFNFEKKSSFLEEDEFEIIFSNKVKIPFEETPIRALISSEREWLYLLDYQGVISHYDINDKYNPAFVSNISVLDKENTPTAMEYLIGGLSILLADNRGNIHQLFLVRNENGALKLTPIRKFKSGEENVLSITSEQLRKGFIVTDSGGSVSIFHTTASRHILTKNIIDKPIKFLGISPRSNKIIVEDIDKTLHVLKLDSEHPEASLNSIWGKVWYENYPEPDYIWQSSSASSDFEPKFSLTPLTFGTFKAAFYAMLVAMPLAICGAIFTAYFMAPKMRGVVKPSIEIMEALPTVILGFLAGLWLAPFVEVHLPGVFSTLITLPLGILVASLIWWYVPENIKLSIPDGWQAALLIPIVLICGWVALAASPWMEQVFFNGNMRLWLTDSMGIGYDQRNSVIIGIAMGFAVIPTIFSIAEDAIFSVPKHLTSGSLALGATPWQTLVRVVLPSASPGIFSATMIGLGRAVGETMIVLMATGNTPVMDFSIFEGMRTLSANVAVELPESEVDSTHYRILFLAALVLFLFTFFFNTIAEIVRQRLRIKYSTL